jgi:PDZ domain-containing protein
VALVLLAIVATALFVLPTGGAYIILPYAARPVDPFVHVEGGHRPRGPGEIYFVDVLVRKATVLERLIPDLREGATIVPADELNPTGVSEEERRQSSLREMERSQHIAGAVALRALGERVRVRGIGALIEQVDPGKPAAAVLEPEDVVIAADGRRVRSPQALRAVLGEHRPGSRVVLRVRRGSRTFQARIRTVGAPDDPTHAIIGVLVDQAAQIHLPRKIKINLRRVGGPSAGLAFALDVLEELGRDVDHGRRIAVTGALDLNGDVLPVGGVKQKTIAARRAGVDVFVVPAGDNAAQARANSDGLRILPVRTFQQALHRLATVKAVG